MENELEATPEQPVKVEKKKAGRPKQKSSSAVEASPELIKMLMQNFSEMMQQNADNTLTLAETLRKPTELEQENIEKQRQQLLRRQKMSIEAARQKKIADDVKIEACRREGHQDKHGTTRFRGQINSDGFIRPMCQKCQLVTEPIKAQPGQTVVDMEKWSGVTEQTLNNMAKMSIGVA